MATYYTSSSATGSGDGSISSEWTLPQATAGVSAGDLVLVKADGSYNLSARLEFTVSGSAGNGTTFRGANANGTDDGTVATINGSGTGANVDTLYLVGANLNLKLENLNIINSRRIGIHLYSPIDNCDILLYNCKVSGSVAAGINDVEASSGAIKKIINCEIYNNPIGLASQGAEMGGWHIINSSFHHNTGAGVEEANGGRQRSAFINSLFYSNGIGINLENSSRGVTVVNCLFFDNTTDGIYVTQNSSVGITVFNSIFRSNGQYGINTLSGGAGFFDLCDYNCFSNNTSGALDIATPGNNNLTGDPSFVSEVDGAEDFSLQAGSPCIDAGLNPVGY